MTPYELAAKLKAERVNTRKMLQFSAPPSVNAADTDQQVAAKAILQAIHDPEQYMDRHKPGYMAAYMREYRARKKA